MSFFNIEPNKKPKKHDSDKIGSISPTLNLKLFKFLSYPPHGPVIRSLGRPQVNLANEKLIRSSWFAVERAFVQSRKCFKKKRGKKSILLVRKGYSQGLHDTGIIPRDVS